MNATTKGIGRQIVAAGFGGVVTTGNALVAVLMETPFEEVTKGQWMVSSLVGTVAAFGAWRTLLAAPGK